MAQNNSKCKPPRFTFLWGGESLAFADPACRRLADVFMHTHPVLDQRTSTSDNPQSTYEKKHSSNAPAASDSGRACASLALARLRADARPPLLSRPAVPSQPINPVVSEPSQLHHKQQKDAAIDADDAAELERKEQSMAAKEANRAQAEAAHQ